MASLWTRIDEYLKQSVQSLDGAHPLFTGVTVEIGEEFDPDHVVAPFVLIRGYEADDTSNEGAFGDGEWHIDVIRYPYEIVYYADSDSLDEAREIAKDSSAVLREMLRADPCLSRIGNSEDGERVTRTEFSNREAFVRGMAGQNRPKRYVAQCLLSFEIHSTI